MIGFEKLEASKICRKMLTDFELITRIMFKAVGETLNRAFSSFARKYCSSTGMKL